MMAWYTQSGTPELEASMVFNPQKNELELNVKQFNPPTSDAKKKKPLPILLQLGMLDYDGKEYLLKQNNSNKESEHSSFLKMEGREQSYIFTDINNAPVPSLLRGFSSPVKLKITLGYKELFVLMTQEKDPFVCWDAGQQYATRIILEIIEARKNEQRFTINSDYIKAVEAILLNDALEPALRAELIKLPSENDLAQAMVVIDVDNIHFARRYIQQHIGQEIKEKLQEIYFKMLDGLSPLDLSTQAMGRRALASVCLLYLTVKENVDSLKVALNQAISAKSMTLTMAALNALNDIECKERDEALDNFFLKWNKQPLELDKWFSLQASSALESSFQTVKDLTKAKEFDILNPNRVRSLLGSFVTNNPVNFHRLDGEGYEFLADKVMQLNSINPQVGARLAIPLTRWHSHIESRRRNMRYQLERIINTDKLSADVLEIVQKGLTKG
jgi:aminopeptidase N